MVQFHIDTSVSLPTSTPPPLTSCSVLHVSVDVHWPPPNISPTTQPPSYSVPSPVFPAFSLLSPHCPIYHKILDYPSPSGITWFPIVPLLFLLLRCLFLFLNLQLRIFCPLYPQLLYLLLSFNGSSSPSVCSYSHHYINYYWFFMQNHYTSLVTFPSFNKLHSSFALIIL